jgi:hypothetical protein
MYLVYRAGRFSPSPGVALLDIPMAQKEADIKSQPVCSLLFELMEIMWYTAIENYQILEMVKQKKDQQTGREAMTSGFTGSRIDGTRVSLWGAVYAVAFEKPNPLLCLHDAGVIP